MGTFAEIAIIDYRLSFIDLGKQPSIFRNRFQQTNGSLPFRIYWFAANKRRLPFSISSVFEIPET
jgi:hypothetical protein